jgi:type I restriction-modification system DNA methylase subunit
MYTCKLCKKEFTQKIDFTRHTSKKTPCISMDKIQALSQSGVINTSHKSNLTALFTHCLDILRNNEHLTGDKALRTLAHLLDLRLLEPQFGSQIDIDTFAYDFSAYDDSIVEHHKAKLLKLVRFSNLAKENEGNLKTIMTCLWEEILSVHPITKNIFLKGKGFDIQHQSTFKKLIDKLYDFKFEAMDEDILGEAYEEVIKDVMTGKVLGQFFTPPKVKQMMVNLIDPQLKEDGTIETVFDPAMGTGGFLITCLRNILNKSKNQHIPLDWDFIRKNGLGGREAEPDTYQLAVSNMLIASGKMFDVLEKGDSIRDPIANKYDIILANPPFGIDGLIYDEIVHELRNEYMPISSNSAVPLFLQAIIHMLKVNGRCAVVLPEGQELFSKNKALVAVREYLMKTCDLKEVIYLPAGTFTHTTIKTCVFYFHKKKEGKDVLETKVKHSKTTQKETERTYVFSKTHQTHKVKFYDYNTENYTKHLLFEVIIEDLAKNNYSLNYAEYFKDETSDEVYEDGVVVKTLGEVCSIDQGNSLIKNDMINGEYRVIGGGKIIGTHNQKNRDGNDFTLTRVGDININYMDSPYYLTDNGFSLKSIQKEIMTKYVYYLLKNNINIIKNSYRGAAQKVISKTNLNAIKIPIPPLARQQEIVTYLDFINEKCIKTSTEKILELKQLNEFCLNTQKVFGENSVKTLGEVCESIKTGKNKPKDNKTGTLYPYYGTGSITGYTNEFLYDGKYILTARNGTIGNCFLTDGKFFPSDHIFVIDIKDKCLMKYVYYILSNNEKLDQLKTGVGIPNITKGTLENLKIHIPSLERQKEIVDYCEFNDTLIQQLKKEIEQNKKQAHLFISGIVKTAGVQSEAHSSTCQFESDGTGCTCRAREIHSVDDSYEYDSSQDDVKSESEPEHCAVASSSPETTLTNSVSVVLDYKSMTREELVKLCKERNIKGISGKSKDKLIEILQK